MAVELRKGQKVSLDKKGGSLGEILVNLNWTQPEAKKGFFARKPQPIDLDLGCLFELKNGLKAAVQALGNAFGNLHAPPYVALDGDDRTGESTGGENLRINGDKLPEIRRILVYTFIYEGVANWRQADGIVTIKYPGAQDLIIRMDDYNSSQRMCALALLENENDETFSVQKVIQFFDGHQPMDKAFNWGLNWVPGRK